MSSPSSSDQSPHPAGPFLPHTTTTTFTRDRIPSKHSASSSSDTSSISGVGIGSAPRSSDLAQKFAHLSHYLNHILPHHPIAPFSSSSVGSGSEHYAEPPPVVIKLGGTGRKRSGSSGGTAAGGATHQHPLSVSSLSSEDEDENEDGRGDSSSRPVDSGDASGAMSDAPLPTLTGSAASRAEPSQMNPAKERDALLASLVELLNAEEEDRVRDLIKNRLGPAGQDEAIVDLICLDMMHKHKDDVDGIPYNTATQLTPIKTRQPTSSPSIVTPTSAYPSRPFTPTRVPSYMSRNAVSRPLSPAPNAGVIGGSTPTHSRPGTPTGGHGQGQHSIFAFASPGVGSSGSAALGLGSVNTALVGFVGNTSGAGLASPQSASSPLPGQSPISSPRMLSAKAQLFSPIPGGATTTPSGPTGSVAMTKTASILPPPSGVPSGMDPWQLARTGSPAISHPLNRSSSNLAVAAPLTMQQEGILSGDAYPSYHPKADRTPSSNGSDEPGVDDIFSGNMFQQHAALVPDDDDEDEFSPFGSPLQHKASTSPATKLKMSARAFDPTRLGPGPSLAFGQMSPGGLSPGGMHSAPQSRSSSGSYFEPGGYGPIDDDYGPSGAMTPGGTPYQPPYNASEDPFASSGMTPLDVLQSVFTSLPQNELEEALIKANYEFEGAMAILIAQNGGTKPGGSSTITPTRGLSPGPHTERPLFPRTASARDREYFHQGGRAGGFGQSGHISPRFGGGRTPGGSIGASRMCRYYLAGECRRADCRFSHDVDRALCRFWLRGQCAKGDQCEFIHNLPNLDPNILANAMARIELQEASRSRPHTPVDDFPSLDMGGGMQNSRSGFDPTRNRFANAVKRGGPSNNRGMYGAPIGGARFAPVAPRRDFSPNPPTARGTLVPVPRPSYRLKLRPPSLMPTLPSGGAVNEMYLEARAAAIKLGQARNACLARAADAWRRGDGASAKRFSKDANVLNDKMHSESAEAASNLVRERRLIVQEAVRSRGEWSDDPGDRVIRGKECGGGLGVIMGVASANGLGMKNLSSEERTEVCLDLHALHANEGVDLLEDFLLALEKQNYLGLAYIIVGDERHTGTQDAARGTSKFRLSVSIKQFLAKWNYPWSEGGGIICIDPLRN